MRVPTRVVVVGVLLSCSAMSYAQQGLIGTYKGEYMERQAENYPKIQNVTLEITSAQNGKLAGKYRLEDFGCRGTYEIEGTYQDDKVNLRTSGGSIVGCDQQQLMLQIQGNKLVGNVTAEAPLRPGIELVRK